MFYPLDVSMPIFNKKAVERRKLCISKVATIHTKQSLRLSQARVGGDFLLKIVILRAKGYNISGPNVQV